ncbi:flagellar basal body-associated FliL family protein [Lichenihabitans sp. Uapishka_5]|uniref:flagellar basal body-associated FliL family protein n=1 Tax=Lichenihabitans sp. Uapishka_5 TaxID=3037302 RepID=UPI0029E7FCC9|nr:flagellar basal body-associated FliL family protein [Lichenihabitans sp. Uapishka_5]MDX7952982.1 flagellar basal body-associated FliL family protein [Lichenihabitans sp. Uapishka_5]
MADDGKAAKKSGGLMGVVVPVLVLTLVAGGGGFVVGKQIVAKARASVSTDDNHHEATAAAAPASTAVRELPPVVANLTAPEGSWVRLQTAIVYNKTDAPQMEILSSKIADDMLAYLRTLSLTQLQGASGIQHLREDLSERAAVRSEGHVSEVMIEMMVIQ